jgi:hypothetical protein
MNTNKGAKEWLVNKQYNQLGQLWEEAQEREKKMLEEMDDKEAYAYLVSKLNLCDRKEALSCEEFGIHICEGDICFADYGCAYLQETGYQHFGLILSICNHKAFIVPLTSNPKAYANAPNKLHMMRLGLAEGMNKRSVVYLNDARWINTSHIVDVKAHLDTRSILFRQVRLNVMMLL